MNHFKLPCQQFCTGVVRWLAVGAWMIALCVPGTLFAQSHEITGKVLDENDMPVVGANVIVDGTTIGTNSGLDGSFKLTVSPPLHKTVSVMYLGYKTAKLDLGSRTNFTVKLEPDRKVIDEVVVVALRYSEKGLRDRFGRFGRQHRPETRSGFQFLHGVVRPSAGSDRDTDIGSARC